MGEADALLICVPTPLSESRDPDLQYVTGTTTSCQGPSTRAIGRFGEYDVSRNNTRDVMLPILKTTGLEAGKTTFWHIVQNEKIQEIPISRPIAFPKL